jgi:hypothetical protein
MIYTAAEAWNYAIPAYYLPVTKELNSTDIWVYTVMYLDDKIRYKESNLVLNLISNTWDYDYNYKLSDNNQELLIMLRKWSWPKYKYYTPNYLK